MDLNRASLEQLLALPGVDEAAAYDLLLWRPFMTWAEVAKAPHVTEGLIEHLKAIGARVGLPDVSAWPASAAELTCGQEDSATSAGRICSEFVES